MLFFFRACNSSSDGMIVPIEMLGIVGGRGCEDLNACKSSLFSWISIPIFLDVPRISIRGCVRPLVRPLVRRSVRWSLRWSVHHAFVKTVRNG